MHAMDAPNPPDGQFTLSSARYGKSTVRLVKVARDTPRHALRDLTVDVALEGRFEGAYVRGDNAGMLATDTMRNTVYALARHHPLDQLEAFGLDLARRFLAAAPTVERARVQIAERPWERITAGGRPHDHAFVQGAGERTATITADSQGATHIAAGVDGLLILKTTESGWVGFHRDEYTTLPDADDRILATVLSATWSYGGRTDLDFERLWSSVRDQILASFTDHYSPSLQHTIYRMGSAVLAAHPEVDEVSFRLPNKHHLLYNLAPFGMDNPNEIFHVTTDPFGLIEGTVARESGRAGDTRHETRDTRHETQ